MRLAIISINRSRINVVVACIFIALFFSCVEPYDFKSETYEKLLVVEATLTDEVKTQVIYLSNVYRIDTDTIFPERNARVSVVDDSQNEFTFQETEPGKYTSSDEFRISSDRKYHLEITTSEGRVYASEDETLPENNAVMEDLYAERATNANGIDGIAIYSNSSASGQEGVSYYKYNYFETYKIVSPYTQSNDLILNNSGALQLVPKTKEEEICYKTRRSKEILLADTGALTENEISNYLIKFFEVDDFEIQDRYSIKASQVSISKQTYDYYETLKELSGSESIFSQNQPGFVKGNIFSETDSNEKVIGNFNLGKVSTKRIFFNFTDFFNLSEKPDPTGNCNITRPRIMTLVNLIRENQVKFYEEVFGRPTDVEGEGPYRVVQNYCIDCTVVGTNIKPEFWID